MKNILYFVVALSLSACAGKNSDSEKARENYNASLADSISAVETRIDSCNNRISELRDMVGVWLRDFTTVSNPREAGSYIILSSFKNHYPLNSTGLIARINDNGQFELIAALQKKAFDKIIVSGPADSASTEVVPYDQALNYRTDTMTTVMFTGQSADSVGQLIADNELNPLSVTFVQSIPVSSWKMSASNAKMISYTYMLYKNQKELNQLERQVPMLHEKINLLRIHQEKNSDDTAK